MRTITGALVGALALAGCATASSPDDVVSASPAERRLTAPLAGPWAGTIWEVGPAYWQGQTDLSIRVEDDGTWEGTVGKNAAAGVVRRRGRDVVFEGTARGETGSVEPVYLRLSGNDRELWGETVATFSGRPANASVSVTREAP